MMLVSIITVKVLKHSKMDKVVTGMSTLNQVSKPNYPFYLTFRIHLDPEVNVLFVLKGLIIYGNEWVYYSVNLSTTSSGQSEGIILMSTNVELTP